MNIHAYCFSGRVAVSLSLLAFLSTACLAAFAGPADKVDTRIGAAHGAGSCPIGTCVPYGSVMPSPDTLYPFEGRRQPPPSGYYPGDPVVGFSQLHVSGAGLVGTGVAIEETAATDGSRRWKVTVTGKGPTVSLMTDMGDDDVREYFFGARVENAAKREISFRGHFTPWNEDGDRACGEESNMSLSLKPGEAKRFAALCYQHSDFVFGLRRKAKISLFLHGLRDGESVYVDSFYVKKPSENVLVFGRNSAR